VVSRSAPDALAVILSPLAALARRSSPSSPCTRVELADRRPLRGRAVSALDDPTVRRVVVGVLERDRMQRCAKARGLPVSFIATDFDKPVSWSRSRGS
jgi:hypothetical protein